ncbi:MFS transporter [Rhodococcus sp. SGAir0479]|uniref:MFS transporter n=1 Tax=Rhodococcus sp. SGAir0479 TaxID=2567884 RepID=UPI0010CD6609|nr:MFS transporter [Rhodococcus sp. SGAir0479]QCQ91700.1 MFS transporter [Rhodococcus sp. SGAir0479]
MDIREAIRTRPMRRYQIQTITICFLLCMVDGFEILIMAFVAPHLSKDWDLDSVQIGYLLSAGLIGMAVGAFFLSPLADRVGRRPMTIACLALITVGMGLSAVAGGLEQLIAFRAFAGLGIGGLVASLNILVSENSSDRRRGLALGVYGAGLPAGVALGGAISGVLISHFGWRSAFVFGTVVTGILLLVVIRALPESTDFLIEKRPKNALAKYNAIATKLGYESSRHLPSPSETGPAGSVRHGLFTGVMGRRTVLLWLGYSCLMAAFYFANTWTPKMLTDVTDDAGVGTVAGVLINVGGVLGALVFAALTMVVRPRVVNTLLMFAGAIVFAAYAGGFEIVALGMALCILVGMAANGGVAGFYAISPSVYPASVRGTGVGLMIGVGRLVSIVAPILTGYLIDAGWAPADLYRLFGVVLVAAGAFMFALDRSYRSRAGDPDAQENSDGVSARSVAVPMSGS